MTSGRTFVQRAWTRAAVNVKNAGRFARFWAGGRRRADFAKTVYLDLREPRMERYYYLLAKFFELAGWQVCIRFDPVLLINLRNYSEFIYDIAGLRFVRSRPSRTDLELSLAAGNTSHSTRSGRPELLSKGQGIWTRSFFHIRCTRMFIISASPIGLNR